jgi:hypothetical protein
MPDVSDFRERQEVGYIGTQSFNSEIKDLPFCLDTFRLHALVCSAVSRFPCKSKSGAWKIEYVLDFPPPRLCLPSLQSLTNQQLRLTTEQDLWVEIPANSMSSVSIPNHVLTSEG